MTAGRKINSQSQDWGTPPKYVEAVKNVFDGEIDLDPCSNDYSIVKAKVEYKLPQQDGLIASWSYPKIFVNPPYGRDKERQTSIKDWLKNCLNAHQQYQSEVLALVPVATNTKHWKDCVWGQATAVCFLYDTRLKFLENGEDKGKGAPMSCAMIYWGNNYQKFWQVFLEFGAVVDLRPLRQESIGQSRQLI
ncbi:MAG: DNA N-6-adenine-methyltransferase [Jaaginema sp. PMC 1080.18]|nr:DNA N-6-adenine-methyltransferase [Jaaginema sp. PMC 1080.18]MEC4868909.1 DNA N-6-adenine-methyltransferase [Jaaginema sp. PMC 1078.18]